VKEEVGIGFPETDEAVEAVAEEVVA
jgi:hypothetical protein